MKNAKNPLCLVISLVHLKYGISVYVLISAVDGFQTRLRSDEKYTHRSKG